MLFPSMARLDTTNFLETALLNGKAYAASVRPEHVAARRANSLLGLSTTVDYMQMGTGNLEK